MYCVNCGFELPNEAKFCMNCGKPVMAIVRPQVQMQEDDADVKYLKQIKSTIPFIYDRIDSEGDAYPYFRAYIGDKVGLLDNRAKTVIPCSYEAIDPYYWNKDKKFSYAEVQLNGKWGFYQDGKEIIPCVYDSVKRYTEYDYTYYLVKINGKFGIIRWNTWESTECKYDKVEIFDTGLFYVWENESKGVLKGVVEIVPCGNYIKQQDKYCLMNDGEKYGIVNLETLETLWLKGYNIDDNACLNRIVIENNGKYGLVRYTTIIIPCIYDVMSFTDRGWRVIKDGKSGIISYEGVTLVDCIYEKIDYYGWCFIVKKDNKISLISIDGKTVIGDFKDSDIKFCEHGGDFFYHLK